jgi:hypothetical protein
MKIIHKSILLIVLAFVIYFSLFLSTYVHEMGHVNAAKEQNISFKISEIKYLPDFKNLKAWGLGASIPSSQANCEKFNSITIENRQKITHAGVNAQMLVFGPLFFVLLLLIIAFWKRLFVSNRFILWFLMVLALLFLVIIVFTIFGNVLSPNPLNDWHTYMFGNCSLFG